MKNKLLGGAALLMAAFSLSEANATSCAVPPTCAQLGYTMTKADCGENPMLRCPFALTDDNQVFCGEIAGAEPVVGAIVYGDGTVTTQILSGTNAPKPIGIVFDARNHLAVALTDVTEAGNAGSEQMRWSNNSYDVENLANCTSITPGTGHYSDGTAESCGVDGRTNTNAILACGSSCGGTPAAACNLHQPTGCTANFCQKGQWFLPSLRDLNNIYLQKAVINATLSSLGRGSLLEDRPYWSSTEYNAYKEWNLSMGGGHRSYDWKDSGNFYVRPVVAF